MHLVIITGVSGAGKSTASRFFEDIGYYCIDNMPPELLLSVAEFVIKSESSVDKMAVAVDIRSGDLFSKFENCVNSLRSHGIDVSVLFVDADDDTLVKRYKETRRKHPLDKEAKGSLYKAIELERKVTLDAKSIADFYIDTSTMGTAEFKHRLKELFCGAEGGIIVNVISFGFKFGLPKDADLVFDVRCLPNPFYVDELKHKTGLDDDVYNYVMNNPDAEAVFTKLKELIDCLIPLYIKEGKLNLVIAFGCTGGQHRSVSFARRMSMYLESKGIQVRTEHRNINR